MRVKPMKLVLLLLLGLALLAAAGCPPDDPAPVDPVEQPPPEVEQIDPPVEDPLRPIAREPAFLTSVGQGAEVFTVRALLERAEVEHSFNILLRAQHLTDQYKTLILEIGGSRKGLGAAGIDPDDEIARVEALLARAAELELVVIVSHLGGEARRGPLSDPFIRTVAPAADYLIVVEAGNKDGLFTRIAAENAIPMDTAATAAATLELFRAAFE